MVQCQVMKTHEVYFVLFVCKKELCKLSLMDS